MVLPPSFLLYIEIALVLEHHDITKWETKNNNVVLFCIFPDSSFYPSTQSVLYHDCEAIQMK